MHSYSAYVIQSMIEEEKEKMKGKQTMNKLKLMMNIVVSSLVDDGYIKCHQAFTAHFVSFFAELDH